MSPRKRKYKWFRRLSRILLLLLLLFIGVVLFVRSSWGQELIVDKVVKSISDKTKTKVEIDRLFITFSGNIYLENLYLEDAKGDTLLYSRSLEANLPISPIVFSNEINLKSLEWNGLIANIKRKEGTEKFNFSFLLDAFASTDTEDTAETEAMVIRLGEFDFKNFKIDYEDQFMGIKSNLQLGSFFTDVNTFNLDQMKFEIDNLEWKDSKITYEQTAPFPISEDTTETQLPLIKINNFKVANVIADYNSLPDELQAAITIGEFETELPKIDLANNAFDIDALLLRDSKIVLHVAAVDSTGQDAAVVSSPKDFIWPEYTIAADNITLENNSINYLAGDRTDQTNAFNPNDIGISDLALKLNGITYRPKEAKLRLINFSFKEKSGFDLRDFSFVLDLNNASSQISQLSLQTNTSSISGKMGLNYDSIDQLLKVPENTKVALSLPNFNLGLSDAYYFNPELAKNEYLKKAEENHLKGTFKASGTLADVNFEDVRADWGGNTSIKAVGSVKNVIDPDSLSFNFTAIQITSVKNDILKFIKEETIGITVPETVGLNVQASGTPTDLYTDMRLVIPEGTARLSGNFSDLGQIAFDGEFKVDSLRLDKLLQNEELGGISFDMTAKGNGSSLNTLNANLQSNFSQLQLKRYNFSGLSLDGEITNGIGAIDLAFKDKNLDAKAKTSLKLDSIASNIGLNLDLIGADFYELGLTKEKIKAGAKLRLDFKGNPEDFYLNGLISDGIAIYDGDRFPLGDINFKATIDSATTDVSLNSNFLTGLLQSNSDPKNLTDALRKQFQNYFSDSSIAATTAKAVTLKFNMALRPTPILTEVFFRDIEHFDSIYANADFDASTKLLNAELHMPSATYAGSTIDSLHVSVNGNATDLDFSAGLASLNYEPIGIKKTFFEGGLKNKKLLLDFISFDGREKLVHVASEMVLAQDTINLRIDPQELILNKNEWSIPSDNKLSIATKFMEFTNMTLSRNSQELTISNNIKGLAKQHVGMSFSNFKLQALVSLLNPDEALTSGLVNGDLIIENPFEATGIIADLNIKDLNVLQQPMGNLTMKASSNEKEFYDFNLALKDGAVDLDLIGDYIADDTAAKLNFDLNLNKLELKIIEAFSDNAIKDSKGIVSGNIDVSGTTASPQYKGELKFDEASFKLAILNSLFKISDNSIQLDSKGVYFDNFEIKDEKDNPFSIDGSILTADITNPSFDLKLIADKFLLLNSSKEDNELYYGTASFDADLAITGDLQLPKIDGKLSALNGTNITYVVSEEQLDVEERDGVVIFVNREDPSAILTRNDDEETPSFIQGIDIKAILEISNEAVLNVVLDEQTGDNLQVSGDAELNLNVEPNGRTTLSGRYELKEGHYETSLYNLVRRRFEIKPGSTITWLGDPFDAKLDVTAVYNVETSASPLMTALTSGQDASVTSTFRQVLPFVVYLNIDGEILNPKLSFLLDMPEDSKGALGGQVYAVVQQLNNQESDLNKQVFSLLALNQFFPNSSSNGSNGGASNVARNNLNQLLSNELNAFSDKILAQRGFELDFDLDSFTDFQGETSQDRTQLNINAKKKLFNNRLIVTAGSTLDVEGSAPVEQNETPIIGNLSLEYLLTENGRYRLKGFRKNEYENIIDGQLIITGIALIFNREFNKFSELFNPLKKRDEKGGEKKKSKK